MCYECIKEMLYHLYEKCPEKIRQLEDIVTDLKEVFELPTGGNVPVRSQRSRWINHKRKALQCMLGRYCAYITLTWQHSQKTAHSSQKIRSSSKYTFESGCTILGCALYVDILKPPSLLSLCLQGSGLDVVLGVKKHSQVSDSSEDSS